MVERVARDAEAEVRLVGLLAMDLQARSVRGLRLERRWLAGLGRRQVAEQLLELRERIVTEVAAEPDDHPLWFVPAFRVAEEGVPVGGADRLLAPDDVPAERLIAVEEFLVDAADEIARRVVVHVHLLDDHAFLAFDLFLGELRVAEHVDEDVERSVAKLGRALDVVARVLLAGESV